MTQAAREHQQRLERRYRVMGTMLYRIADGPRAEPFATFKTAADAEFCRDRLTERDDLLAGKPRMAL